MNDSESLAYCSRYIEQLKAMDDMNDFRPCAQGSRIYDQLKLWTI